MFYILVKNPEHYIIVQQKLSAFCCQIFDVRGIFLNDSAASELYSDIKHLAYFQNAVDSLKNRTVIVIRFTHPLMDLTEIKKIIQGPYGNFDESTIRGYLTIYLNNGNVDSFVHIPDTDEKIHQDLQLFNMLA